MSKIILTAAVVVSVGVLSFIKTTTTVTEEKVSEIKIEKVSANSRVAVLATAD